MSSKSRKRKSKRREYDRWHRELMERFYRNGGVCLTVKSEMPEQALADFRKHWYEMVGMLGES